MSLDTRDRRAAAVAGSLLWQVVPPVPDASVATLEDRRHVAGLVRLVTSVPAGPAESAVTLVERRRIWTRERCSPALRERRAQWLREETR